MLTLHVSVNGEKKVIEGLQNIRGKAKDLRPAFRIAGGFIMESVGRTFRAGGRPEAWKPLSKATLKRRGQGALILQDIGTLMTSIGAKSGDGIMVLKPLELRVGTNVPYARYHQEGIGVPARPFMQLLPEDEEKIVKAITEHIMGGEK